MSVRWLALLACAVAVAPVHAHSEPAPSPDEKLFKPFDQPVGDFKLQERNGQYVRTRDLLGKVWVAQFFYPGCNLCSRNTPTMKKLQDHYRGKSDVGLVSIDLIESNLKTLQDFASDHEAEPGQWLFLTGPEGDVHEIVRLCFFNMTFRKKNPELGDAISHSTNLVVVDQHGTMVGYVDGTDDRAFEMLKTEIDRLRVKGRLEGRIPVTGADLPWFNAMLNSTCTLLLLLGYIAIRIGWQTVHKIIMLLALAVSMVFLASYLFYHFAVMGMEPTRFAGTGAARYVYFTILTSHTLLAIVVAPLALYIAVQGLRNSLAAHVRVARWTLPLWLYVSVTGVVVYWMLYRMQW
jgi:protein SCO1/2/putative membrane protein